MPSTVNSAARPHAPRRLWFGAIGSVASWTTLGCLDIVITFIACTHQDDFGIPGTHPGVVLLFVLITAALFTITSLAGITSYRNWRSLSTQTNILEASAVEHHEFISLLGVVISITLGVGIVWLALPPLFLDLCWRAR